MRIPVARENDGRHAVFEKPTRPFPDEVVPEARIEGDAEPKTQAGTGPLCEETGAVESAVDYEDLYLRAMADMANFRRRTEERAKEQVEEERRRLLGEFLELADNLERALVHLDEPGLRRGVRLTWEGLQRFLEREGVEPIRALGQPFDPQVHEAVATAAEVGKTGQVVEEVQRGYRYRGRLLRPARVVVGR